MLIILILLLLVAAAGFLIWWFFLKSTEAAPPGMRENFLGQFSAAYKIENETAPMNADMPYYSAPGFVNRLSPRFNNTDVERAIWKSGQPLSNRSDVSGGQNSAVPADPLATCDSCTGNVAGRSEGSNPTDPNNTIVVDRLIFANQRSRTRGQGDPIRGDIPIVPNNPGWFGVSVTPQIDLERGALQAMAGENESSRNFNDLLTLSRTNMMPENGMDYANSMFVQMGNRGADVTVQAFP